MDRYVHVTDKSLVMAIHQFKNPTPANYEKGRRKNIEKGRNPLKQKVSEQD